MNNKLVTLILFITIGVYLVSCGVSPRKAADYNDDILQLHKLVEQEIIAVNNSINEGQIANMDSALSKARKALDNAAVSLQQIGGFNNDTLFFHAVSRHFSLISQLFHEDYPKLIRLYCLPEKDYTEKQERQMKVSVQHIDEKIKKSVNALVDAQKQFAEKYNLVLHKSKI
jgi:hypothetical protein